MTAITIEIQDQEVRALLARLRTAASDLTPVMTEIGDLFLSHIKQGFETSTDPSGVPWLPVKQRKGRPLVDTGQLMRSFMARAMSNSVEVGTALEYAAIHQFGGQAGRNRATPIPARPFVPTPGADGMASLPPAWRADILDAVNRHLTKAIGG
jgi:phage virion morphogenesis protein